MSEPFNIELREVYGHGSYGVVRQGYAHMFSETKDLVVAVKEILHSSIMSRSRQNSRSQGRAGVPQNACREIGILRELNHPHVLKLLAVMINSGSKVDADKHIRLVLEWAEYDLKEILARHAANENELPPDRRGHAVMPLSMIRAIMFQLLDACDYIHSQWIMHRDIKPANILLTLDGQVKLADFGLARVFQSPPRPLVDDGLVVTRWYRAPELLLGSRHYTPSVDVWSLGVVFGEMLLSSVMFRCTKEGDAEETFQKEQLLKIFQTMGRPDLASWPSAVEMLHWPHIHEADLATCPTMMEAQEKTKSFIIQRMMSALPRRAAQAECVDAFNLLLAMLIYDPAKRITCKDAKERPFFRSTGPETLKNCNVLMEMGQNWRSYYGIRKPCDCPDCKKNAEEEAKKKAASGQGV